MTSGSPKRNSFSALLAGIAAYLIWGISPIYYKQIANVPPLIILCHRVVWSVILLVLIVSVMRAWPELRAALRSGRSLLILFASTILIGANWYLFIWTTNSGRIMQASLGYFITPLITVFLGVLFLRERLRPAQLVSFLFAIVGVLILAVGLGQFPGVALLLAITFSLYGLLRKIVRVGSLMGLTVETSLLFPIALALILSPMGAKRLGPELITPLPQWLWLVSAGVVTTIPLLLFTTAARRLRLVTIGFLQYIGPTCQFFVALVLYHEPFTRTHLYSFLFIWTALAIFSADSIFALRALAPQEALAALPE